MAAIEFVFFDLGNVLVHFDHSIIGQNLSQLTGLAVSQIDEILFGSEHRLQHRYESGLISTDELLVAFNTAANSDLDIVTFCRAISDIFLLNRSVIPAVTQLHLIKVPFAILSNTCPAHWDFILQQFPLLKTFFANANNVLSFEVGNMKPEAEIYRAAIAAAGCRADRILFIDDRPENCQGGADAGMWTYQFTSAVALVKQLNAHDLRVNL